MSSSDPASDRQCLPGEYLPSTAQHQQGRVNAARSSRDDWTDYDRPASSNVIMSSSRQSSAPASPSSPRRAYQPYASPSRSSSSSLAGSGKRPVTSARRRKTQRVPVGGSVDSGRSTPPARPPSPSSRVTTWDRTISLLGKLTRMTWSVFSIILTPFLPYILLGLLIIVALSTASYLLRSYLPSLLFSLLGSLVHLLLPFRLPGLSSSNFDLGLTSSTLPLRAFATPTCFFTGQLCDLSLLSPDASGDQGAKSMWEHWPFITSTPDEGPTVHRAEVARVVAHEVKGITDIFESVSEMAGGGMIESLNPLALFKMSQSIAINSYIDDKDVVGEEVEELGAITGKLSDKMRLVYVKSINTFSMLFREFAAVERRLGSNDSEKAPSGVVLSHRVSNILKRLVPELDDIISQLTSAIAIAADGSDQGKRVYTSLHVHKATLEREYGEYPLAKKVFDRSARLISGGEVRQSDRVRRDLLLIDNTLRPINQLLTAMEIARSGLVQYRDQVSSFDVSIFGVHNAADAGILDFESEMDILGPIMQAFGEAVDSGKQRKSEMNRANDEVPRLGWQW